MYLLLFFFESLTPQEKLRYMWRYILFASMALILFWMTYRSPQFLGSKHDNHFKDRQT